ncbi:2Fe-2S iron-sulfur cluster-binding protein [Streptomyces sp. NPDC059740]|uniref:2Fe-2S iron-sulfur cluster-binding protein n=1 Tax=Streptomyces sp. NPDC059740 TaxID=3346926 RepID=UPI00364F9C55
MPAGYTAPRAADEVTRPLAPEVRRTYSVCCPPSPGTTLRVGVRQVVGGEFSTYAVKELAVGDLLDVMAPTGRFVLPPQPGHFAAVVGGSGITPVLSMATTLLAEEPSARFTLVRSDRSSDSAMFLEEVAELKDRYPDRFHLVHVLTREELQAGPVSGRLDEARLTTLLPALLTVSAVDGWYLCGPLGLVRSSTSALLGLGVPRHLVHQEIFHAEETDTDPATGRATDTDTTGAPSRENRGAPSSTPAPSTPLDATLTGTLHGRSGTWSSGRSETVLETVLRHRPDAPYACRGGVCGTCRALLVDGEVHMARDFALEPGEVSAGYVLTCQSRPVTAHVEVDFDR